MFSVLLSLYKKEHSLYLKQCLDSLFSQTLLPTEIILVKDGPLTEDLNTVVEDYEKDFSILKIIPLEKNVGLGRALNEGLKHCSYNLIARMDTDDIAKPYRFQKQIEVFQKHPEIDVCGAWIEEFQGNTDNVTSIRKLPKLHNDILEYTKIRNPINHPVVMFRKSAVLDAGGYQHFPLFEDYYLWVRMLKNGAKFYNIQESLLYFRTSPDMFKRRGGWKYAMNEYRFQKTMFNMNIISYKQFILNVMARFPVRIAPNQLRSWLYKKALRK